MTREFSAAIEKRADGTLKVHPIEPVRRASHEPDCGYHLDQYPWECSCGAIPDAASKRPVSLGGPERAPTEPHPVERLLADIEAEMFRPLPPPATHMVGITGADNTAITHPPMPADLAESLAAHPPVQNVGAITAPPRHAAIEAMAAGIWSLIEGWDWADLPQDVRDTVRHECWAALGALAAAGYAIVPTEPTVEMRRAARFSAAEQDWPAMVDAGRVKP